MPLPRWLAQINKRTFNRLELKRGKRPVLIHEGRSSGKTYYTPLDAHPVDGGYMFIANYGTRSDWMRNILAAGSARLRIDGRELALASPRLLDEKEAWELLPEGTKPLPKSMNITDFVRMDASE